MFYSALTVIYATTFAMFMPFIKIYTAALEDAGVYLIPILGILFCVNGLLFSVKTPQGMMVIAAGLYKETKIQTTVQGAILVVGGILFTGVFQWGLYGVVIAGILSNLYRAVDFVLYIEKHVVEGSLRGTVLNILSCFVIVAAVFLLSLHIRFGEATVLMWVLNAAVIGVISIAAVLIVSFIFQRENLFAAFGRVKSLFKR